MRIEFDPINTEEARIVRSFLASIANGETLVEVEEPLPETTSDPAEPEYDSKGELYDSRIHSTPPTTNKDGTWRAKRGVKAEEIATVRAEREATPPVALTEETVEEVASITATDGAGMTVTDNPETGERTEGGPISPDQEISSNEGAPEVFTPTPSAPPAPPVTTAPPAPIATGSPSFLDVMKAITAAQKDGKIDTAKVKELCAAVGAGENTMGLNGPDNGDKRSVFLRVVSLDPEARDAMIAAAKDAPGVDTFRALLGDA